MILSDKVRQRPAGTDGGRRREQLLNAAAALILQSGTGNISLEAVSEAANVSKGGLLYHFDSKPALLEALADHLCEQLAAEIRREAAADAAGKGSGARAYLRAIARIGALPVEQQFCKALTFICDVQPELVPRVFRQIRAAAHFGSTDDQMTLNELHLILVADGLWQADIHGAYNITAERRVALLEVLGLA